MQQLILIECFVSTSTMALLSISTFHFSQLIVEGREQAGKKSTLQA